MTLPALIAVLLSQTPNLPYPAPRHIAATSELRCDWGPVVEVQAQAGHLLIQTGVGVVTYIVSPSQYVYGPEGNISGSVNALRAGQSVHVYFRYADGARVDEVDLDK